MAYTQSAASIFRARDMVGPRQKAGVVRRSETSKQVIREFGHAVYDASQSRIAPTRNRYQNIQQRAGR